jgi:hypothetical protein
MFKSDWLSLKKRPENGVYGLIRGAICVGIWWFFTRFVRWIGNLKKMRNIIYF